MNVDKFGQKIETFREYVNNLLQHNTLEGLPLQQLEQALEEFSVTLEELEVAQEELLQQNEELQTARQKAETERQRAETERQKAETERQRAEVEPQRYQDLFEQAPDGYFVTTKEGTIQEVNRAAATLLNYSQNFLISKSIFDFIVEQERPAFQTELAQPRIGDWVREWEVRFLVRDRKPVDVALTVAAVRNPQNKVQTLRWQLRDITEKKQAERYATFLDEASRLLASSLDYRTTLNHVAKLAVPTLADWCFIDIIENNLTVFDNPVVVASDPKKEALVLELRRRYPPSPDADYGAPKVLRTGIPELVTEIPDSIPLAIASDAEHLDLLLQLEAKSYMIVPLTIQERKLGTISFASSQPGRHYTQKDLAMATELARRAAIALDNARLYREAQAANRLKDEFLAIVSHELRTPLHAILGWAKMLRNRKLNEATTNKALATIERNAKLQEKLIEDILDISRIVQGKIRLNTRPVYLAPIIDAVIENMHPTADIKNIQIESMLDSSVGQVMGDAERLQQIVWNLLSNAVKFTPAGGRVEVRLEQLNNNAQITISDTGIGITPNFLPYIFDRFRQADSTTTRSHNGLGLGLAIVRHLVEMHSGTVYAASEGEGRGATFTVQIPLINSQHQQPIFDTAVKFDSLPALNGLQILVVDDNADNCELITAILEHDGARVTAVFSATEALDVISRLKPDVLISDIGMPEHDGYWLIRQVKIKQANQGWQIPAIALTAFAREEERIQALSAGFHVHIAKPVEPTELVTVITKLVERKGQLEQQQM